MDNPSMNDIWYQDNQINESTSNELGVGPALFWFDLDESVSPEHGDSGTVNILHSVELLSEFGALDQTICLSHSNYPHHYSALSTSSKNYAWGEPDTPVVVNGGYCPPSNPDLQAREERNSSEAIMSEPLETALSPCSSTFVSSPYPSASIVCIDALGVVFGNVERFDIGIGRLLVPGSSADQP
jgi:hypothetical protein